jgi:hypothetical protein
MKGWHIFLHSLLQVTGNLTGAIKVSALPYLVQFAVTGLVFGFGANALDPENLVQGDISGTEFWLSASLAFVIALFTGFWIAVAWHRFVLLGEDASGYLPVLKSDRIWAYCVRSLGLFLVLIAASIIIFIPATLLFGITENLVGPSIISGLFPLLFMIPVFVVLYRVSGSLPGAALGSGVDFWAGWNATKGANLDKLVLVLIFFGVSIVLDWLGMIPVIGIAVQFIGGWLVLMVGASVLTTIYGHYIEGRDLSTIKEPPNVFE